MRIVPNRIIIIMVVFLLPLTNVIAAPDPPPPSTPPPPPGLPVDGGLFVLTTLCVLFAFYKIYRLNTKKAS
jgi:hypothetical protein